LRSLAAATGATAIVALSYRLLHVHFLRESPFLLHPVVDAAAHLEWARGLLAGTWPGEEPFFRAPGYVFALAAALFLAGDDPARVAVSQVLLGTVTPVLVALVAGRLRGPAGAWVAGLGAAIYPMFPFFDGQLLAPVLALPLLLVFTLAALPVLERPGAGRAALAGLAGSAAAIVRPPLLLAAAMLPLFLLARAGSGRRARSAAAALGGILLLPALVTLRNAACGDPVFIASQGGFNFYVGNCRGADGVTAAFPDRPNALGYEKIAAAARLAEEREGRPLRASEVSRHYTRRALGELREDPPGRVRLLARKAALFWFDREIPSNHDPAVFAQIVRSMRWTPGWWLWAPLGVLGLALARRERAALFLASMILAVAVSCVLFFVNARFRLPAAPLLVVLGAVGVLEIARAARRAKWRRLATLAAAAGMLGLLMRWNHAGLPRGPWPAAYVTIAEAAEESGELDAALELVERALEADPSLFSARVARIDVLWKMGRTAEARSVAAACVEEFPDEPTFRVQHAMLLDVAGNPEAALAEVEKALLLDERHAKAAILRAFVLHRLGRREDARRTLTDFARENPREEETIGAVLRTLGLAGSPGAGGSRAEERP
jgi:tetratricopeptide (TPR) repeat protein